MSLPSSVRVALAVFGLVACADDARGVRGDAGALDSGVLDSRTLDSGVLDSGTVNDASRQDASDGGKEHDDLDATVQPDAQADGGPELADGASEPDDAEAGSDEDARTLVKPWPVCDRDKGECACEDCVTEMCTEDGDLVATCRDIPGNAESGPAKDTPRNVLCLELLKCARRTRCAEIDSETCLCGDTEHKTCWGDFSTATGPCKAEIFAAAETEDSSQIAMRMLRPGFASGAALLMAECEEWSCAESCIAPAL